MGQDLWPYDHIQDTPILMKGFMLVRFYVTGLDVAHHQLSGFRSDEIRNRSAKQLLSIVTESFQKGLIGIEKKTLFGQHDAFKRCIRKDPVAFLAFLNSLLVLLAFGDIGDDAPDTGDFPHLDNGSGVDDNGEGATILSQGSIFIRSCLLPFQEYADILLGSLPVIWDEHLCCLQTLIQIQPGVAE